MLAAAIASPPASGPPPRDGAYQHIKSRYFSSLRLNPADANRRASLEAPAAVTQSREWHHTRRRSRTLENVQPPTGSSAVKIEKSASREELPFAMSMPASALLAQAAAGAGQSFAPRAALDHRPLDASWDDDEEQDEDSEPDIVTSHPIAIPSNGEAVEAQTARSTARTLAPRRMLQEKDNFEMQQKRKQDRMRMLAEQLE